MCRNRKIMCKICDWAILGKLLNESKKEKIGLSKEQIWLAEERWTDKIGVNNVQIYLFSPGTFGFLFINVKWLNKICYLCHAFREIYLYTLPHTTTPTTLKPSNNTHNNTTHTNNTTTLQHTKEPTTATITALQH